MKFLMCIYYTLSTIKLKISNAPIYRFNKGILKLSCL